MSDHVIDGEWVGSYVNPSAALPDGGQEFEIAASIRTDGASLRGTMIDTTFHYETPLAILVEQSRLGSGERAMLERFLESHPSTVVASDIASESDLEGKVVGSTVQFIKRYHGPQTTIWRDEESVYVSHVVSNHRVRYQGVLSSNGEMIEGKWSIKAGGLAGLLGKTDGEGTFSPTRQPTHAEAR